MNTNEIPVVEPTSRKEVYKAIQTELAYQDRQRENKRWTAGADSNPASRKWTIGGHTLTLLRYVQKAADQWVTGKGFFAIENGESVLDIQRKIAAISTRAMMSMWGYDRVDVESTFDDERMYQKRKWGNDIDDINTPADFVVYELQYVHRAMNETSTLDPAKAMQCIIKVGALAIACMERWGAPLRASSDGLQISTPEQILANQHLPIMKPRC